jgi:hypothetical protein
MNAASLGKLWVHIVHHRDAQLDEEGEIKSWTLDDMVAIHHVKRCPVHLHR